MKLKVHEIFYSIQGESSRVGLPTVFVRLTGCPMRCVYCDTAYAFSGGSNIEIAKALASQMIDNEDIAMVVRQAAAIYMINKYRDDDEEE